METIKTIISEHPDWLRSPGTKISFAKISTPTSGREVGKGKVLLFVFEEGEKTPTLCVKTVRTFEAGDSIEKSFDNLKLLEASVLGTRFEKMFATPLYLYNHSQEVFSIETVCKGASLASQPEKLDLVIEEYKAWQEHLGDKAIQHGDLTPDNVLVDGDQVSFVDYDSVSETWPKDFDLFCLIWKSKMSKEKIDEYLKKYLPPNLPFELYREASTERKKNI